MFVEQLDRASQRGTVETIGREALPIRFTSYRVSLAMDSEHSVTAKRT